MQTLDTQHRSRRSIASRLYAIIALLGAIPMLGAAFALMMVTHAVEDSTALDQVARGSIHLERVNGLVYAVVMESRSIARSPDWQTAQSSVHKLTDDFVQLQDAANAVKSEAIASQRSNVDQLARRVDEFVHICTERFRKEVGRLNSPDSMPVSPSADDSEQNVPAALNEILGTLTHAYELEIGKARGRVENDNRYFVHGLGALAGIAFVALCIGVFLIRRSLLAPLLRVRRSMLRLAEGDLDTADAGRKPMVEIAEMEHAIAVFRSGLLERGRLNRETRLLSELNEWLQSCNSLNELYDMVGQFLSRLLPNCAGGLYVYANSRDVLEGTKAWNGGSVLASIHPEDCWGLRRGHIYDFGEHEIGFRCAHVGAEGHEHYFCIPILAHGETIGLLHVEYHAEDEAEGPHGRPAGMVEQRRLALVSAEQISLAIANVKLRDQLRDQSIRDSLTGLFNRRYMLETCRREFSRAARTNQSVSLLSIDVDHFKKFNDNHGHDAGDTVLREVGNCLEGMFRNEDVACRFGGEEFVVIMPGASVDDAAKRAEALRARIEGITVRYLEKTLPRITISVGLAAFPAAGDNPELVLRAADNALYRAKEGGRNRVEVLSSTAAGKPVRHEDTGPSEIGRLAAD